MAKLINLGRARKRIARDQKAKLAETNRAKFGRTLAERTRDEQQAARAKAALEQHRLTDEDQR